MSFCRPHGAHHRPQESDIAHIEKHYPRVYSISTIDLFLLRSSTKMYRMTFVIQRNIWETFKGILTKHDDNELQSRFESCTPNLLVFFELFDFIYHRVLFTGSMFIILIFRIFQSITGSDTNLELLTCSVSIFQFCYNCFNDVSKKWCDSAQFRSNFQVAALVYIYRQVVLIKSVATWRELLEIRKNVNGPRWKQDYAICNT